MVKVSIVLVNFIGLFFAGLFSGTEIMVDNNTPATIVPGEKQLVTVTVQKGSVSGFAKLELSVPFGLTISPAETNGASFTFSAQKAKFIWMMLPVDQNFTLTYYLEASPGMEGQYEVQGDFSYISDNQRVDYRIPSKVVLVSKSIPLAANVNTPVPAKVETSVQETSPAEVKTSTPAETTYNDLTCLRTVTKQSETEFIVKLKIVNNNIKGFAKISETVPDNCKTEKIDDDGAVVTLDKNAIKFVWFEIPVLPTVEVSYRITCLSPPDEQPDIVGKLSFVENNAPKEMPVISTGAMVVEPMAQTNVPVETNTPIAEEKKKVEAVITQPIAETKTAEPKTETKPNTTTEKKVTSVPSAETGVTYKVQILAAHRVVGKSYFNSAFNYADSFDIENHEGWVKYTTGKYNEYKQARDKRENLRSSYTLPGPFVTAYSNGERITVQEALLISKQQWYQ